MTCAARTSEIPTFPQLLDKAGKGQNPTPMVELIHEEPYLNRDMLDSSRNSEPPGQIPRGRRRHYTKGMWFLLEPIPMRSSRLRFKPSGSMS